jgi:hypothetical protein
MIARSRLRHSKMLKKHENAEHAEHAESFS